MTKFDQVLSNDELLEVFSSKKGSGDYNALDVMRWAQEAVLAKLHEQQEPVAWRVHPFDYGVGVDGAYAITQEKSLSDSWERKGWSVTPLYAHPEPVLEEEPFTPRNPAEMRDFIGMNFDSLQYANHETEEPHEMDRYTLTIHDLLSAFSWCGHYDTDDRMPIVKRSVSPVSHKTACVSEKAECETQDILNMAEKHGLFYNDAGEYKPWIKEDGGFNGEIISFARELIKENHRTAKNHIPDTSKMIKSGGDMFWIDTERPSAPNVLDALEHLYCFTTPKVGDQLLIYRAKTLPSITVEVTELHENEDVKAYRVISTDAPKHDGGSHD